MLTMLAMLTTPPMGTVTSLRGSVWVETGIYSWTGEKRLQIFGGICVFSVSVLSRFPFSGLKFAERSDLFPKQRCERLGVHFVLNCFNEAVEINLRVSRSGPPDVVLQETFWISSRMFICRSASRERRAEGRKGGE